MNIYDKCEFLVIRAIKNSLENIIIYNPDLPNGLDIKTTGISIKKNGF